MGMLAKHTGTVSSFVYSHTDYFLVATIGLGTVLGAGHIAECKTDVSRSLQSTEVSSLRTLGDVRNIQPHREFL